MADELRSTVRSVGTTIKETAGQVADDTKTAAEGLMVPENYDQAVDAAKEGVEAAKDAAVAGHDFIKKFMEENPHTTTAIALGIGVLVGYTATRRT
jgi:ElaB/YqjD/DUF883 family membrane-anchored ribosome-binding protein